MTSLFSFYAFGNFLLQQTSLMHMIIWNYRQNLVKQFKYRGIEGSGKDSKRISDIRTARRVMCRERNREKSVQKQLGKMAVVASIWRSLILTCCHLSFSVIPHFSFVTFSTTSMLLSNGLFLFLAISSPFPPLFYPSVFPRQFLLAAVSIGYVVSVYPFRISNAHT